MERAVIRVKEGWWELKEPTEVLVATCMEEALPQLQQLFRALCGRVCGV